MKLAKRTLVGFSLLALSLGTASGQQPQTSAPQTPAAIADLFLQRLAKGDVDAAVDDIARGSMLQEKVSEITLLKGQIKTIGSIYGANLGHELVREIKTKESVVHLVYLGKQEKVPLTWHFIFYKPKTAWLLMGVSFNDRLQGLEE